LPVGVTGSPEKQPGPKLIVAVRKNVRLDPDAIANASLDGKFSAVYFGFYGFNHDAAQRAECAID